MKTPQGTSGGGTRPSMRRLGAIGLGLVLLVGVGAWAYTQRSGAEGPGLMHQRPTPTHPWGENGDSDRAALNFEFDVFTSTFEAELDAAAAGAAVADVDWMAAWYNARVLGAITTPPELTAGLVDEDAAAKAEFCELVKARLVPWVVSHPREAAMAYLAPSAKPPSLSAGEGPRVLATQPPHQADIVLLGQAVATFDARLAELAASRQVPLETVTPDPALLLAAMASEDLSSSASIQLFAAYEKAFAAVAAAPAPGSTP